MAVLYRRYSKLSIPDALKTAKLTALATCLKRYPGESIGPKDKQDVHH